MMETDKDKLLTDFFGKHKQEIPDNGFSKKVMKRISSKTTVLATIWSMFCGILALVFFFAFDGLKVLGKAVLKILVEFIEYAYTVDLRMVAIVGGVLLIVWVGRVLSTE